MHDQDHWWFEEIAASNNCYDLSMKALLITYSAETTAPRWIRYHQKLDHTCTSVDSTTHSAKIMFYQYIKQLVVPLNSFVGADLTLGYGFTFYGPMDIMEIALVDIGETYQAHVPTTDIVHVADYPSTVTAWMLSKTELTLKYHIEAEFSWGSELNLTGKLLKIVYSCGFSGLRRLYVVQQVKRIPAHILFTTGNHTYTLVPLSFFLGADPSLGIVKLVLRGPLTFHCLELVNAPTSQSHHIDLAKTRPVLPIRPHYSISHEKILDDFLTQIYMKDLRMQISVTFDNNAENNYCEKNVRLFYTQLSHALSGPAGFLPGADKTLNIYPIIYKDGYANWYAVQEMNHKLRSIGSFVGSSILHGHLLDLTFSPAIYWNILGIDSIKVSMEICSFQYPEMVNGKRMYSTDSCDCSRPYHKKLNEDQLTKQVKSNILEFLEGFYSIVPSWYLTDMNICDLKNLMHGKLDFDLGDWKAHTVLEGFVQEDITIQLFWLILAEWDTVLKSKLLYFVTGSPHVAYVGFKSLNGGLFTIRKNDDQSVLPSSDKCGNILNLPAYVDLETMKNRLKDALKDSIPSAV